VTAVRLSFAVLLTLACASGSTAAGPTVLVQLEKTDGTTVSGTLAAVSATAATLVGADPVAVAGVRRILADTPDAQGRVVIECADGGTLSGDDFSWDGGPAMVLLPTGRVELPVDRVRSVTLRQPRGGGEAGRSDWRAALPENPQTDLVVVGKQEEGVERIDVVECAIVAVTPDTVVVVLDEERIPVKRAKVIGLWFLREAAAAGGARVEIVGGGLTARSVVWTPEGLVLDDAVRVPAAALRSIDYAAGRTVRLETLRPERSETEPFFGVLGRLDGLAPYFAARFVADRGGQSLVLRPRSHVVWRVPADARTFRAAVAAEPGRQPGGETVALLLDDREVFRRRLDDGGATAVEIDVAGGRRLAIKVEFPAGGGMGCPLRFADPVFEK
jgi:hypothetical protein